MKTTKSLIKPSSKQHRERKVLFGLIEYYLKTARPVGSNTLKEMGFEDLSSATIRNYFAKLEEKGYLIQQHISGGRIPSHKAYRLYANEYVDEIPPKEIHHSKNPFNILRTNESREITLFLQQAAENLAQQTQAAVFLSAPRFEQDLIINIKLIVIDHSRCLCVLMTDFGQVIPEILQTEQKLSVFSAKRIETYFNWRINNQQQHEELTEEEKALAQHLYNELMMRYVVNHTNFNNEEIYRTGLSRLLVYPEFHDPAFLVNSLALFENTHSMRLLLKECSALDKLKFWIGEDLSPYTHESNPDTTVIAIPYRVNNHPIGAVALLGPARFSYRQAFALLYLFSESISEALTNNLYKFKIEMHPSSQQKNKVKNKKVINQKSSPLLIENNPSTRRKSP